MEGNKKQISKMSKWIAISINSWKAFWVHLILYAYLCVTLVNRVMEGGINSISGGRIFLIFYFGLILLLSFLKLREDKKLE